MGAGGDEGGHRLFQERDSAGRDANDVGAAGVLKTYSRCFGEVEL